MEHGKGIYVYDTEGREYLEATASLGYQNDELADAIAAQYRDRPPSCRACTEQGRGRCAKCSARCLVALSGSLRSLLGRRPRGLGRIGDRDTRGTRWHSPNSRQANTPLRWRTT